MEVKIISYDLRRHIKPHDLIFLKLLNTWKLRSLLGLVINISIHKYLKSHNYHQISYEFHSGALILTNIHELIRKYWKVIVIVEKMKVY